MKKRIKPTQADKFLPHLGEPITSTALAAAVNSTYPGTESAMKAMHRKGLVKKIIRRQGSDYLPHQWVSV